ncbi:Uncharacterized membrane protein YeaQ/YmgE, transglycosylase-associated protein family [Clostridium cavendishii DSM 21758]|uniref:Uncharacterized membrane protein YeaQ/YmgE, transglycosylase-associated protein family n=1 Tax=Clostridium cavendishii DSM 21758 TaxID=1121302 RepID=A0A1M6CDN1_9CLOT|nr:hypothetical protein [Clostridium cavendishii]SHI59122.1 Uncharacterized membrane protein YeaQ/YmgE, transglycosylase-associated protein family [Clostridium cavendishii DSM 21758]
MNKKLQKNKIKNVLKKMVFIILAIGIGGIIGIIIGKVTSGNSIFINLICIMLIIIAFILQLILHELGHLICGIWSGYEFVSFRVGTLTFVKENGKIVIKKYKIVGTAGQCLMMPPKGNEYDYPYAFYNLGGILMNVLISFLSIILYIVFPMPKLLGTFLIFITISGIYDLLANGIPMKVSGVVNDGYNLLSLKRDKFARYSFYTQLRVNGLLYQGVRMKDIPGKWYEIPSQVDLSNSLFSSMKCLEAAYYHDRKEFDKAKECYENLLNDAPNLINLFKNEINCELLFYEIIGECRQDVIDELYTKELKKYIKATNCYITRKRLMYTYAVIIEKDIEEANKILNEIEKIKKTYPAKAEIESELEIIEFVKQNKY